jgi:hypothetical protein
LRCRRSALRRSFARTLPLPSPGRSETPRRSTYCDGRAARAFPGDRCGGARARPFAARCAATALQRARTEIIEQFRRGGFGVRRIERVRALGSAVTFAISD